MRSPHETGSFSRIRTDPRSCTPSAISQGREPSFPHRALEAAADFERGLDDGVARQTWRHRLEIGDFAGRRLRLIPVLLVRSRLDAGDRLFYADKRSGLPAYCPGKVGKSGVR
jgi:hypothetical protein